MVNVDLLKAEIDDIGIPKSTLADRCGMSRQTLDNKLDNPATITANDALAFVKALRIADTSRVMEIFFAE